jgi:hypothetical protein
VSPGNGYEGRKKQATKQVGSGMVADNWGKWASR